MEALYFGTKVLGMPILEEQRGVAYRIESMGIGRRIKTVHTVQEVYDLVELVLFNSP